MLHINEQTDHIVATIDRPEADNRLNTELLSELKNLLTDLSHASVPQKVFVLAATGANFSLGRQRSSDPQSVSEVRAEFELIQSVNELLYRLPLVSISALQGKVEGAGLSLGGRCDIVVVTDESLLSFPEIPHGIPPTIVLSHYRYILPAHMLGDLFFAGRVLTGQEAVRFGLAARSVQQTELKQEIETLTHRIAQYDRDSMRLVKKFLRDTEQIPSSEAPQLGIAEYVLHTFRNQN